MLFKSFIVLLKHKQDYVITNLTKDVEDSTLASARHPKIITQLKKSRQGDGSIYWLGSGEYYFHDTTDKSKIFKVCNK